jgi:arsenate reductase
MLAFKKGELRKLFNTAGQDYRDQKLKDKLPNLLNDEAFSLLSSNGNLVKRPFLLGPTVGLLGFDEAEWTSALDLLRPAGKGVSGLSDGCD